MKAGVALTPDSYVHRMIMETSSMNSDERAAWLEKDDEIDAAQEVATAEGQVMTTKVHNYIADENNISDLRQRLLCFFN